MECFSEELLNTADKAIFGFNTMNLDELLREVKAVAVQPVAIGILRATAHSARQAHGERFQAFTAKVRGLTTDCKYILPCPHVPVGEQVCTIVGCIGVDYMPEVIKVILLSGMYDHDVRREVLGDSTVKDKTVNELIRFVKAKEAACDAAIGGRPQPHHTRGLPGRTATTSNSSSRGMARHMTRAPRNSAVDAAKWT